MIKLKPVHAMLLLTLLAATGLRAQVFRSTFNYEEFIVSNYSSLVPGGAEGAARHDTLMHAGEMDFQPLNDSLLFIQINSSRFNSTAAIQEVKGVLHFYAWLDSNYRVKSVSVVDGDPGIVHPIRMWLGEINFQLPSRGKKVEARMDGQINVEYAMQPDNEGGIQLKKIKPFMLRQTNNRQSIAIKHHDWLGEFDAARKFPAAIKFSEYKIQKLGRRTLACINRQLKFTVRMVKGVYNEQALPSVNPSGKLELYPLFDEITRKRRLAESLLGNETSLSLLEKLKSVDQLSGEGAFRLKSRLRSAIILDSSAASVFRRVIDTISTSSLAHQVLESAFIESKTPAGTSYIYSQLTRSAHDYSRLKQILLAASLAGAITPSISEFLIELLQSSGDEDSKNMIGLALSNYAASLPDSKPELYERIMEQVLEPFSKQITDTLQYLYLVGNAGKIEEMDRVISIMATNADYLHESVFALRNISSPLADSLVFQYLLTVPGSGPAMASLLANRPMQPAFTNALAKKIRLADASGDSTLLPALQYLLDNADEPGARETELISHDFRMEVYRKEIMDYRKESSLCAG